MDISKLMKEDLGFTLILTSRFHKILSMQEFTKFGISTGQPIILDHLTFHDGCIQNDLANHCHIKPATATGIIASMEEQGLIRREVCPNDKRKTLVYITEEGKNKRELIRIKREEMSEKMFKGFSEEEKIETLAYLERIFLNLKESIEKEGECKND